MGWFKHKHTENQFQLQPYQYIAEVKLDLAKYPNLKNQIEILGLTKEDLAILKQLQPYNQEIISTMVDHFYDAITLSEELVQIIEKHSKIEKLKITLTRHVQELFNCQIDEAYVEQRKKIAKAHVKIGLRSKWYIGSFQSIINTYSMFIKSLPLSKEDCTRAINAFHKLINLEQQLVIEAYENEEESIRDTHEKMRESLISQINLTAEELNAISEETNASLIEIAGQADEINASTKQGLIFAQNTEQKSLTSRQEIMQQHAIMKTVTDQLDLLENAMNNLNESSRKITDIVGLVTGIADQTNLLALNASIEAARAGEHGKGFAVVADEVRKLAEETKHAVQNVSSLIRSTEENIAAMEKSVIQVDTHVKNSVESQHVIETSLEEIIEAVSGIKEQYSTTAEEIQNISNVIAELSEATNQVAVSSDALVRVVNELNE